MNKGRLPLLSLFLCANMLLAGCMAMIDNKDIEEKEEPTQSLDDVPTVSRTVGAPELVGFDDCEDLGESIKETLFEEYKTQLLQEANEIYRYFFDDAMVMEDGAEMAADASSGTANSVSQTQQPRVEGEDFSGTNNQVEGVDEADFVKTDGYFIYYLNGKTLHVLSTAIPGTISLVTEMVMEGTPQAMMLNGDRLVVISSVNSWNIDPTDPLADHLGWDGQWSSWRTNTLTKFTVIDLSNRSTPEIVRELYIEGYYNTAREIDGSVRAVTYAWMNIPNLRSWLNLPSEYYELDYKDPLRKEMRFKAADDAILANRNALDGMNVTDLLPKVYEKQQNMVVTYDLDDGECVDFVAPKDSSNRGFISIFTMDLLSESLSFEADHILGNHPLVYASADTLILTENSWDWWWFWGDHDGDEATNIHVFDISDAGDTEYIGSGRVNGTILNQFSISEYEGHIRVATTTGQWNQWWLDNPEPMSSQVVVLEQEIQSDQSIRYVEIGSVVGIAPTERIWSCRFVEEKAYIVTFRNIDPLWTIDLSDPSNPVIMGELEIPGVSTYIHPLSDDRLLTIGYGPGENGLDLDWRQIQISLFDVSNMSNPTRTDVISITPLSLNQSLNEWVWASSEATYEHKAFQYWAPKGLLAVPMSVYRYVHAPDYSWWHYDFVSKLMLINVSDSNLSIYGSEDHSDFYNRDSKQHYWNDYNIRRSIFMGDFVYAISSGGVTVTNLTSLETVDEVTLTPSTYYYYSIESETETSQSEEEKEEHESGETEGSDSSDSPPPANES